MFKSVFLIYSSSSTQIPIASSNIIKETLIKGMDSYIGESRNCHNTMAKELLLLSSKEVYSLKRSTLASCHKFLKHFMLEYISSDIALVSSIAYWISALYNTSSAAFSATTETVFALSSMCTAISLILEFMDCVASDMSEVS